MFIRQWKEKEPNLNCSASSIANDCSQKYCQKIAKAYCFAMGFGNFRLEGIVLRKKATLPNKQEELFFISDCRLVCLSSVRYTAYIDKIEKNDSLFIVIGYLPDNHSILALSKSHEICGKMRKS